ncbi:MAG: cation transporting ATPase C-terminal domain-containing protein, partial [Armatimonadota bacterium]
NEPVVNKPIMERITRAALIMLVGTLALYLWGLQHHPDANRPRTLAFVVMVFFQVFNVFNVRSLNYSLFRIGVLSNPYVILGATSSTLAQIMAVNTNLFQQAFRIVPLTLAEWLLCMVIASSVFWVEEIRKAIVARGSPH